MREPSGGDGWTELFVDVLRPDSAIETESVADALAASYSVALFDSVASPAECELLCSAAVAAACESVATNDGDGQSVQAGRFRGRVDQSLDSDSQALCDRVLQRVISRVRALMPTLLPRFFGALDGNESILHHPSLVFSPGEPAINVYTCGGNFDPHTDKQSLTILVPLSRARGDGGGGGGGDGCCEDVDGAAEGGCDSVLRPAPDKGLEYDGGGTAFFCRHAAPLLAAASPPTHASGDIAPPKVVVKPPPGTAIVFCGDMRHAGQPVVGGTRKWRPTTLCTSSPHDELCKRNRCQLTDGADVLTVCANVFTARAGCVLVASFSAKVSAPGGLGATSGWLEHPFLPQVYIPAKKQSLQAQALAAARKARNDQKERDATLVAAATAPL